MPQHLGPRTGASQRLRQHCSENPRHSASQQSRGISNIKTLIPQFLRTTGKAAAILEQTVAYGYIYIYIGFYGSASFSDLIRTGEATFLAAPRRALGREGFVDQCSRSSRLRNPILPLAGVTMRATEKVKPHVRNLNKGAMR